MLSFLLNIVGLILFFLKMKHKVKSLEHNKMMNDDGIIVIETDETERDLEELSKIDSIKITDQRKYGRASLIFIGV